MSIRTEKSFGTMLSQTEAMAIFAHNQMQKRSVNLLLVGSVLGFMGFLNATIIGMNEYGFTELGTNFMGDHYESGRNYKPQTVSEMVNNPASPEGKAFFAFVLTGAICILMSWYPWELRNVYVGDDLVPFSRAPTWCSMRQFFPPVGMLMVACIPTYPPVNWTFGQRMVVILHTCGAVLALGGYCLLELHCLLFASRHAVSRPTLCGLRFKPREKATRLAVVLLALFSALVFEGCGALANKSIHWGCADDWRVPTHEQLDLLRADPTKAQLYAQAAEAIRLDRKLLYNTAHGECLLIKSGEFWFEVICGVFVMFSHWVIWYFCPERHLDLPNSLPELTKEEYEKQGYPKHVISSGLDNDSSYRQIAA